jgi:periplasmic protein TonB
MGIGSGVGPGAVRVIPETAAGVSRPSTIYSREPFYPESASDAKIEGLEELEITICVDGNLRDVSVLNSLGPEFDQQAIAAVKQWRFKPATKHGKPVQSKELVVIDFKAVLRRVGAGSGAAEARQK